MIAWLFSAALAGPLEVERARDHLLAGRVDQAFEQIRPETASSMDPRTWLVFFSACEAVGLGDACRAEASVRSERHPELGLLSSWHQRLLGADVTVDGDGTLARAAAGQIDGSDLPPAVEESLARSARNDPDAAVERALVWLDGHPDHPDVMLPLFAEDVPPRASLGKLRKRIEKRAKRALKTVDDAAVALRWRRLLLRMGSPAAEAWTARVTELTGQAPLPIEKMERSALLRLARRVVDGDAELPVAIPEDREYVMLEALRIAMSEGRAASMLPRFAAWVDAWPSVTSSLALTRAYLEQNDVESAADEVERALRLAVEPWPSDRAGIDRTARKEALAAALAQRGAVRLAAGRPAAAAVDLMVANQIAPAPVQVDQLEKAMEAGSFALATTKAQLDTRSTPAQEVALKRGQEALESGDVSGAIEAFGQAIEVLCLPSHRRARLTATLPGQRELAFAFALRGQAYRASGDRLRAAIDLQVATLLLPWSAPADWWEASAALRDGDAAWLARAMAHYTSGGEASVPSDAISALPPDRAVTAAIYAALASAWSAGKGDEEPAPERLTITQGRVIRFDRTSGGGSGGGRRPSLNAPFPPFRLQVDGGTIGLRRGRIHLVSFVRIDSGPSRRHLTALRGVVSRMRSQGLDVQTIAIALDDDPTVLEKVAGRNQWGTLAWDPALGARFGVDVVPTTWVVDGEGIARFVHVGYLDPAQYEAEIRHVAAR